MPLFPQIGPQYLEEGHRDVLSRMESFYAESITINQSFWGEADTDTRFESGDQAIWNNTYGNLPLNNKRQFTFNHIRPIVNMVSGHQRRNRKSTIVTPVENGDDDTADQFTKILMWINQQEGVLETISESFHGACVTGMNLLHVWMDYRNDPISGNIRLNNCSYNSFLIDPFFRKPDLSDCNGLWKRSFLTKRECLSLLPKDSEEIMGLQGNDNRDGKFQFMPENYNYGMKNLLTYDEFWYRDYRPQRLLVDTQTGESLEWRSKDKEALGKFLNQYPQITEIIQDIPTVRLAIVVQGRVMYDGPNPMGIDLYPFVPVLGFYNPQIPYFPQRITGLVRGMRDPQYLFNRRKTIELDIFESQVNSGWIYKENALVDPKEVYMSGQGRGIALKEEAQMTDVQQIIAPQVPPSMFQASESLAKEIQDVSGVNQELMGSAVDDKAGVLAMLRQGAGLTTLQGLFDQLDHSQRLLGRLMLQLIQANFTHGKAKRILEDEPTKQFYSKTFGVYDAVIEDGLNTSTQKQMNFAQLLQLRQEGVQIPDDILLEAATIQNKTKLVKAIQTQQQSAAQAQQAQAQMEMKIQQAQLELTKSTVNANEGLGMERASKVMGNQAQAKEREAASLRDKELGLLNFIKALKEIEGMDLGHIEKMLKMAQSISQAEAQTLGEPNAAGQQPSAPNEQRPTTQMPSEAM